MTFGRQYLIFFKRGKYDCFNIFVINIIFLHLEEALLIKRTIPLCVLTFPIITQIIASKHFVYYTYFAQTSYEFLFVVTFIDFIFYYAPPLEPRRGEALPRSQLSA